MLCLQDSAFAGNSLGTSVLEVAIGKSAKVFENSTPWGGILLTVIASCWIFYLAAFLG
jgi:hypothetical protein